MKHPFGLLLSILCLFLICSSCDDYVERGIEGQWQMTNVIKADGSNQQVDSIYYSFKKGVFKYLRMETDLASYYAFGQYNEHDNQLNVNLTDFWTEPHQSALGWGTNTNGEYITQRAYTVKRKTSSALELELEGERYIFRKY
jgi:hypothetical protein